MKLIAIISTSMAAFVLMLSLSFYFLKPATIASFDMRAVRLELIKQLAMHNASKTQVQATTLKFNTHLKTLLNQYAQAHHVVIIDSALVLAGAHDINANILPQLIKLMGQQS